ncbi:beta subunit of N-acylethanolamine-hydrolyzing acid amidase-domain-containing protein [Cadophora sp. MPI-SDFR-AT-0126]|nr:beta subunit of N-acylethanolamine-hydrolyzing acid amidase-domain-containing protein [Leotiomycetes sp. MPI-SDFR-AT-0126]
MVPPEPPPKDTPIPTYRIDLSLPPAERYVQLATKFAPEMRSLTSLLDEVLQLVVPWLWLRKFIEWLASIFLRRVHSGEETEELRGISKSSGVDLYFLIALNVLLDSLLGCTSGGVMTSLGRKGGGGKRMMHFRTLDWGMDPLRSVLVVLEFKRSKSDDPELIIGRSITYAGFVGMLTGVRKDLSVSLNFRPTHSCSTLALRKHQLLVLLGFRPSVCSFIRNMITPSEFKQQMNPVPLENQVATFPKLRFPPCYLILSDGTSTAVIERDLNNAEVRTDKEFIIITNNDTKSVDPAKPPTTTPNKEKSSLVLDMDSWIEESEERKACVERKWSSVKSRQQKKLVQDEVSPKDLVSSGWASVREETLKNWLRAYPVMNECTHFMCIMDAQEGTVRFLERGVVIDDDTEDGSGEELS